jgi:hypothetical protein
MRHTCSVINASLSACALRYKIASTILYLNCCGFKNCFPSIRTYGAVAISLRVGNGCAEEPEVPYNKAMSDNCTTFFTAVITLIPRNLVASDRLIHFCTHGSAAEVVCLSLLSGQCKSSINRLCNMFVPCKWHCLGLSNHAVSVPHQSTAF